MNIDLHIHSSFSDGSFTIQRIAEAAIEKRITVIGITDHFDTRKTHSLPSEGIPGYLEEIDRVQALYTDSITILKGIEVDTLDMVFTSRDITNHNWLDQLDYMLFEYIANKPPLRIPLDYLRGLVGRIPIPVGLAHTDLPDAFPQYPFDELVDILTESNLFVELNESYNRMGEHRPFYHHLMPHAELLRNSNLYLTVGSDMHRSFDHLGSDNAMTFLNTCGLTHRIHPMIKRHTKSDPGV